MVGPVVTRDGRPGKVVLVGPRGNPKGAMLVVSAQNGDAVQPVPLADHLSDLEPTALLEALCMQERAFGDSGLEPPELS
ncbi:MAG: hypothetical protein GY851_33435 [bacterium]|nr:hypothetical protein [bacterium]